jgi:glycosyltransferase involved in cell wall biosynthesis
VELPGWLDPSESAALLQRTDILALPPFVENLPMAVIEAFAYGVAVVATPVGALPKMIDHDRNGLLVPVGDAEALANALNHVLECRFDRLASSVCAASCTPFIRAKNIF